MSNFSFFDPVLVQGGRKFQGPAYFLEEKQGEFGPVSTLWDPVMGRRAWASSRFLKPRTPEPGEREEARKDYDLGGRSPQGGASKKSLEEEIRSSLIWASTLTDRYGNPLTWSRLEEVARKGLHTRKVDSRSDWSQEVWERVKNTWVEERKKWVEEMKKQGEQEEA